MAKRLNERKEAIYRYIQDYFEENDQMPSERDIVAGTGIPAATVHRILVAMRESGDLSFDGGRRGVRTKRMMSISQKNAVPVLGTVACGPGQEEREEFIEYIHMSQSLVGHGDFFALIAKGESMISAGVHPGDYVIVRKQQTAENGDIIVALLEGKNNLKILKKDGKKCILCSCNNENPEDYPDILPEPGEELIIQGLAVGVYHSLPNMKEYLSQRP